MLKNQFPCLNNSFIANYNFDVSMKSLNGDVYQYRWEGEGKKNNVNITSCCLKTTQYHCVTDASVDLQKESIGSNPNLICLKSEQFNIQWVI